MKNSYWFIIVVGQNSNNISYWNYMEKLRLHLSFFICLADGTENLGLDNRDREVEEPLDIQDDTKIEKQGGSGQ